MPSDAVSKSKIALALLANAGLTYAYYQNNQLSIPGNLLNTRLAGVAVSFFIQSAIRPYIDKKPEELKKKVVFDLLTLATIGAACYYTQVAGKIDLLAFGFFSITQLAIYHGFLAPAKVQVKTETRVETKVEHKVDVVGAMGAFPVPDKILCEFFTELSQAGLSVRSRIIPGDPRKWDLLEKTKASPIEHKESERRDSDPSTLSGKKDYKPKRWDAKNHPPLQPEDLIKDESLISPPGSVVIEVDFSERADQADNFISYIAREKNVFACYCRILVLHKPTPALLDALGNSGILKNVITLVIKGATATAKVEVTKEQIAKIKEKHPSICAFDLREATIKSPTSPSSQGLSVTPVNLFNPPYLVYYPENSSDMNVALESLKRFSTNSLSVSTKQSFPTALAFVSKVSYGKGVNAKGIQDLQLYARSLRALDLSGAELDYNDLSEVFLRFPGISYLSLEKCKIRLSRDPKAGPILLLDGIKSEFSSFINLTKRNIALNIRGLSFTVSGTPVGPAVHEEFELFLRMVAADVYKFSGAKMVAVIIGQERDFDPSQKRKEQRT